MPNSKRILDYPHDGNVGLVAQLEIVSDSPFQISIPGNVPSGQSFIHNSHQRRFFVVMGGELAATEKRESAWS